MKHEYSIAVLVKRLLWEREKLAEWRAQPGSYANRQEFLFNKHIADIQAAIQLLEVDQIL